MRKPPRCLQFPCPQCGAAAGRRCFIISTNYTSILCAKRSALVPSVAPSSVARSVPKEKIKKAVKAIIYPKCMSAQERLQWAAEIAVGGRERRRYVCNH